MLWVDLFIIWLLEDYCRFWAIPPTHNVNSENNAAVYNEVKYKGEEYQLKNRSLTFEVAYTSYLFLDILIVCLWVRFVKRIILCVCTCSVYVSHYFPLLWLATRMSSGAVTCALGLLHQYWCQNTSVPSVQDQALEANERTHKVEWTRLFWLLVVTEHRQNNHIILKFVG